MQMEAVRSAPGIPVVDLAPYLAGAPGARAAAAHSVAHALETIGFFAITGHGVSQPVVRSALDQARAFFALPLEEKLAVRITPAHRGYMPMSDQHRVEAARPNLSESFLVGSELAADDPDVIAGKPLHGPNRWPTRPPGLRSAMEAHYGGMLALGLRLVDLFETALETPDGFFRACYQRPMAFVRALHYPPAPAVRPADQFGAAPHSDFGFLTIVAQDGVGGLQVRRRDGQWLDAPSTPDTFVVNVGDMMMRWTNDRFLSTLHRVINPPAADRYSLAFFFDPQFETKVACLPSCRSAANPPRYPETSWGEFLTARFDAQHKYRQPGAQAE
jgi:isopenicillin N synthase-like dioxygenase